MKITIDVPQELVERHEALDSSATLNDSLIIALREYLEYWEGALDEMEIDYRNRAKCGFGNAVHRR